MNALQYAEELVAFESPSYLSNTPVSDYVQQTLERIGFATERVEYEDDQGVPKVNVVGKKGPGTGGMAYFGHTDVVPADDWSLTDHGPFEPHVTGERLYGRGSCDMKGSVACMLAAAESVESSQLKRPIYITCTADEEIGYGGARQVAARSQLFAEMVEHDCRGIIGEPTSLQVVYGHKGTFGFRATSHGRSAHSSTREGLNANLAMIPFLMEMKDIHDETEADARWHHDEFDPPGPSWNIGVNDHTRAVNMTAAQSICTVYFRPVPGCDPRELLERAQTAAERHGAEFQLLHSGPPFYVEPTSEYVQEVLELTGNDTARTVCYGTDASMLTALRRLVVLGPGSIAQAHTADEWIALEQLELGQQMYSRLVEQWCCR